MDILKNIVNHTNDISLWQPCKKVVKQLSQKTIFEKHGSSVLLMYPRTFETTLHLSYEEVLLWLVESDADVEDEIIKLGLYKLSVTSALNYMYDDNNYIKYWIDDNQHHRLTGTNNWELIQTEDGEIVLFYQFDTPVLRAKILTHQCMLDFKL